MSLKSHLSQSIKIVPFAVAIAMIMFGSIALLGWTLDSSYLKAIIPGLTPMNPMTAVSFFCLASCLLLLRSDGLRWRVPVFVLVGVVLTIAGSRIFATTFGTNQALDTLLFSSRLDRELQPNRMAMPTAWCFVLSALSLYFLAAPKRNPWATQVLSLIPTVVGVLVVNCYVFAVLGHQTPGAAVPMALHTAILFAMVAMAVYTLSPTEGFARALMQETSSSKLARSLMVALVFVPPLLAVVSQIGSYLGLYRAEYQGAIIVTGLAGIFAVLVWLGARESSKNEEKVRHAQMQADRANAAKSEFLSRMSHELRTPLNAVIGYAQLLELCSDHPKTLEASKSILRSGRHLLGLINEVLDLAKIEAGKMSLSIEPVLVDTAISQAIDLVQPIAEGRNVTIHLNSETWDGQYVSADRQRLVQVLLNLLTNAVKYNREGGRIDLRCQELGSGQLRIEVADTGFGMDDEGVSRLFVPFERVGDLTVEGTGLGLALSNNLSRLMKAELSLVQTSAEGSTFALTMKEAKAPTMAMEISDEQRRLFVSEGDNLRIVYIEDNASNVQLLEHVFEEVGGVELLPAIMGSIGIQLVEEHMPDLVFLDLHLPDIPGTEVLKKLRANPKTKGIPVVVLSADATDGQVERLIKAGAQAYLTKPLDLSALFAEVNNVKAELRKAS